MLISNRAGGEPRSLRISAEGTGKFRLSVSLILFLAVLSGCSGEEKNERVELIIESAGGPVIVMVEVANTPSQREQGLMYRKELKDGYGMIFIFERDQIMTFWMKNPLIPLSIAYIAQDGRILEIHDMQPGDLTPVRSGRSARYALEVPQGWFDRAGIVPGDRLDVRGIEE